MKKDAISRVFCLNKYLAIPNHWHISHNQLGLTRENETSRVWTMV